MPFFWSCRKPFRDDAPRWEKVALSIVWVPQELQVPHHLPPSAGRQGTASPAVSTGAQLLRIVLFFATPWTVVMHQGPLSMKFSCQRILDQVSISSSRGIFPTQRLNRHLMHCRLDSLPLCCLGSLPCCVDPSKSWTVWRSVLLLCVET